MHVIDISYSLASIITICHADSVSGQKNWKGTKTYYSLIIKCKRSLHLYFSKAVRPKILIPNDIALSIEFKLVIRY